MGGTRLAKRPGRGSAVVQGKKQRGRDREKIGARHISG